MFLSKRRCYINTSSTTVLCFLGRLYYLTEGAGKVISYPIISGALPVLFSLSSFKADDHEDWEGKALIPHSFRVVEYFLYLFHYITCGKSWRFLSALAIFHVGVPTRNWITFKSFTRLLESDKKVLTRKDLRRKSAEQAGLITVMTEKQTALESNRNTKFM